MSTLPPTSHDDPAQLAALQSQLLAAVLERLGAMWVLKDGDSGRYLALGEAYARWLGESVAALLGRTDADVFDPAAAAAIRAADRNALELGAPVTVEQRIERAGRRSEFSVLRVPHRGNDGRTRLSCVWFDLAAQRQKEAQLRQALDQLEQQQRLNAQLRQDLYDQQGLRDAATGLYHVAHFDDQLKREVDLSNREHREFALVWIALDPPPPEVALLGEPARLGVLAALGRLLRSNTRAMDASCRLDDGRFAVLLSGVGLATAHSRMEGLRRQCATQIVMLDGREIRFTVSMGVASFPHTAHTLEDLLAACQGALAEAQRRGGNHVTLASIRFEPG